MSRSSIALITLVYAVTRFHAASIKKADRAASLVEAARVCGFAVPFLPDDWQTILREAVGRGGHPIAARIQRAEQLASGGPVGWEKSPALLTAVLSTLDTPAHHAHYLPGELRLDDSLFPFRGTNERFLTEAKRAWDGFAEAALGTAAPETVESAVSALVYLLTRFASRTAAPTLDGLSDVALADLGRVTAALAGALDEAASGVVCLIEGDLSGIQNFIYTITARGATPALRGRSFYLQLLTEAVARWLLRALDLPLTNLIYASGGHFYLIAPAGSAGLVAAAQPDLDRLMLDVHDGGVYIALGAADVGAGEFTGGKFTEAWRRAGQQVSIAKRRRFASLGREVFAVPDHGGDADHECQVCHHEGDDVYAERDGDREPVRKCALCRSLEQLGRDLRDAEQIALVTLPPAAAQPGDRAYHAALARLGMGVMIDREYEGWTDAPPDAQGAVLLGLRGVPDESAARRLADRLGRDVVRGTRFTVNVVPRLVNRDRATFADLEQAATGLKRIGVLRMDVDNLGRVFSQGLRGPQPGTSRSTLARVASLSAALTHYFEGWVGVLCRLVNDEREQQGQTQPVYTIYSGGDDLFIVGAWDVLPALAQAISSDFVEYNGGHGKLTVSGGIALFGGKQPLYQAADDGADALDAAKAVPGKNAFSLFGVSQSWEQFTGVTAHWCERLVTIVQATGNRALLGLLMDMTEQYYAAREEQRRQGSADKVVWGAYMWRSAYQLTRAANRHPAVRMEIEAVRNALQENHFAAIEPIGLAAKWAAALLRNENEGR